MTRCKEILVKWFWMKLNVDYSFIRLNYSKFYALMVARNRIKRIVGCVVVVRRNSCNRMKLKCNDYQRNTNCCLLILHHFSSIQAGCYKSHLVQLQIWERHDLQIRNMVPGKHREWYSYTEKWLGLSIIDFPTELQTLTRPPTGSWTWWNEGCSLACWGYAHIPGGRNTKKGQWFMNIAPRSFES